MSGFIISHRKVWDNPVFKGSAVRVGVWDWMLKTAAYKDTTHIVGSEVIDIKRGQLCVSQSQIIEATGMARQPLRTFLNILEKTTTISTRPATNATKGKTLITICNYEEYQTQQPKSNQASTKEQPKSNQLKKQRNKVTRDTNVSQDASATAILRACVSLDVAKDFVEHRRSLKKPLTDRAASAIAKKLEGHPSPDSVLDDSIANGWVGVFPEKTKPQLKAVNGGQNGRRNFDDNHREYVRLIGEGKINRGPDPSDPFAGG